MRCQRCSIQVLPTAGVPRSGQFLSYNMLREMQREVYTGHPFESRHQIDYSTNNPPPQLHAADDLDCCFMAFLSWRKPVGPRIMRKLWINLREQTDDKEEKQTEDNSRLRGVESQLRAAAQRARHVHTSLISKSRF